MLAVTQNVGDRGLFWLSCFKRIERKQPGLHSFQKFLCVASLKLKRENEEEEKEYCFHGLPQGLIRKHKIQNSVFVLVRNRFFYARLAIDPASADQDQ
jgi:hypothetical protein